MSGRQMKMNFPSTRQASLQTLTGRFCSGLTLCMPQVDPLAITVRDFMAMPAGPPYYQLIGGTLYMSHSPNWRHQQVSSNIEFAIRLYLQKENIGRVLCSTQCDFE